MPARDAFPVWQRSGLTFGVNICGDLNHPEAARRLTVQGAGLICVPINMTLRPRKADWWRGPSLEKLQDSAHHARCWLAAADVTGPGMDDWFSHGCTAIIAPDGTVAARSAELAEDVLLFDLP